MFFLLVYYNIGFCETTNPLCNFGFAQSATLNADSDIKRLYKYRNVILSGSEYIAIYDHVADITTRGRFSWFVNELEEFPNIYLIKPDAEITEYKKQGAVDFLKKGESNIYAENDGEAMQRSKGVGVDGNGDFLTIVSHLKLRVEKNDNGAVIALDDRTDTLFDSSTKVNMNEELYEFHGYRGLLSRYHNGDCRLACFEGQRIRLGDVTVLSENSALAASIECIDGKYSGQLIVTNPDVITLEKNDYVNAVSLTLGEYKWTAAEDSFRIEKIEDGYQWKENKAFDRNIHSHEFGFNGFDFRRKKLDRSYPFEEE